MLLNTVKKYEQERRIFDENLREMEQDSCEEKKQKENK
jgi:hypothetical protein